MSQTRPPEGRYGPTPDRAARRRNVVVLWVLGLAGLGVALWLGVGAARTPVTWEDVGFSLDTPGEVEVVYDVTRLDPSVTVRCTLEALNHQYAQVGVLEVEVAPASTRTQRLESTVRVSEPAVTGIVKRCWVP